MKKNSRPSPGYCSAAALLLAPPTDKEASPLRLPFLIQVKTFLWLSNPAWSSHSTPPEDQRGSGQEEQRAPPPAWETPTACAATQPERGWKQSLFTPNALTDTWVLMFSRVAFEISDFWLWKEVWDTRYGGDWWCKEKKLIWNCKCTILPLPSCQQFVLKLSCL